MKSLWQEEVELPKFPSLEGDTRTDVVIVGGGMAGLLCAHRLHRRGIPYLLVEKGRITEGTTGHTTAKLTLQHGLIYHRIEKDRGREAAELYYKLQKDALEEYGRLCREIDCDYQVLPHAVYTVDNRRALEEEMRVLESLGASAEWMERADLSIKTAGAVSVRDQACFHPLKFLNAIVGDLNIRENTFVRKVEEGCVHTDRGRIFAKRILVTTHFPMINRHGSYFLKLYQHRSYVLALKNVSLPDRMYVDDDHSGLSFRPVGELLLMGGGGHRTGKDEGGYAELRRAARLYAPTAEEVAAWGAQDCMSLDGMPYIGRYSAGMAGVYVASGFNKWGMTGSMVAAEGLTAELLGEAFEGKELFSPSRGMLKTQLWINGGESIKNLLTFSGKRCSHMGCALKWNRQEHTWDCPCHGSRFSEEGRILNNPANKDLPNKNEK